MDILPWILPPLFGFVIGFATNALAIRMLFRPYREVRVLGLRFQGMIPRRKGDIAATISRTVVSELLREESVAVRLAGPEVRDSLLDLALDLWRRYLARARGTLAELLGEESRRALERTLLQVLPEAAGAAGRWTATTEGTDFCEALIETLLRRTPAQLLRGEEWLVAGTVRARIADWVSAQDLETRLQPVAARALVTLAGTDVPIGSLLPVGIRAVALGAIRPALPSLLRRFGDALLSAPNVKRLKTAVRAGIETYLLETEGGIVKNVVRQAALMGRNRIYQEADEIVDANLHRLRELVYREENRAHLEEGIAEALDRILARTPADLLQALPPEAREAFHGRVAEWLCGQLRRPEVGEAMSQLLARELEQVSGRTLRDLARSAGFGGNPAGRWARQFAQWAAHGGLESLAEREKGRIVPGLLGIRLGDVETSLPIPLVAEVMGVALNHLMPAIAGRVPEILRIVDVQGLVEREVLGFSPEEVERVILTVAGRELRSITWWGGILGALVGGLQAALALWVF